MLKRIDSLTWSLLVFADIILKVLFLPDTALTQVLTIGFAIVCGAGALLSLNKPVVSNDADAPSGQP
jgi:hypothetical protein